MIPVPVDALGVVLRGSHAGDPGASRGLVPGSRGVAGQGLVQVTAGVVGLPVPRKPNCAGAPAFSTAL